jgi:hypothetical protein
MYKEIIEENPSTTALEVEKLRDEVAVLIGQQATLAQQNLRASTLLQKLGKTYGFGVAGKLEWANFKLKFKQEQLADCEQRYSNTLLPDGPPGLHLAAPIRETARQKMERMVLENPLELEPHIRRVYQPLMAAEQ